MKEQAIKKINKIGKVSSIIAKIAKIIMIIGMVAVLIGTITCFVLPKDTVVVEMAGKMNMNLNLEHFDISEQDILEGLDEGELELKTQNVTIGSIGTDFNLSVMEQDYNPVEIKQDEKNVLMKLETDMNSFTLRDVGFFMIMAFVAMVMTYITLHFVDALCKEFKKCSSPFDENVIKKMKNLAISLIPFTIISSVIESSLMSFMQGKLSLNLSIDLGIALVVLIVFVLMYIFKYGAILQQESDETL